MSEHNINLYIKEVFSPKDGKPTRIHVTDNSQCDYMIYIDEKIKSIVPLGDGKIDHKEIFKFIDDFLTEISTETQKDA